VLFMAVFEDATLRSDCCLRNQLLMPRCLRLLHRSASGACGRLAPKHNTKPQTASFFAPPRAPIIFQNGSLVTHHGFI